MSPEDPKTRAAQERILGSMTPADFYSKSPYPSKAPSPHVPSPLRYAASPGVPIALHHVLTPGTPTATRGSSASFAIVIGPSPNGYARPTLGNPSITTKKRGRPFRSPQAASVQPIAKKKGRPFKTPEAAAAAAARASRGNSTDQILKKRRRPFKYPQAPEEIDPVDPAEPRFVPFICEWNDCPAELHNLDTLAAHLITVHLKKQSSAGPLICLWRNCCQKNKAMNNDGSLKVFDKGVEFKTKEEWRNHVKLHLDHVARWQGDGPQTELCKCQDCRSKVLFLY